MSADILALMIDDEWDDIKSNNILALMIDEWNDIINQRSSMSRVEGKRLFDSFIPLPTKWPHGAKGRQWFSTPFGGAFAWSLMRFGRCPTVLKGLWKLVFEILHDASKGDDLARFVVVAVETSPQSRSHIDVRLKLFRQPAQISKCDAVQRRTKSIGVFVKRLFEPNDFLTKVFPPHWLAAIHPCSKLIIAL